jgi:XTP/dITP diphosphohydrolase
MSDQVRRLLVATSNQGKLREFRALLPPEIELLSIRDRPVNLPPESGATFEEIAQSKAIAAAAQTGLPALADDSGLEVSALNGAPGIHSARFAGDDATDEDNRVKLLSKLETIPTRDRGARFRCVVALAMPDGEVRTSEGRCEGSVARSPIGDNGFGYDPIFLLPDGRTMAQISPAEKNAISHRARAYRALVPELLQLLGLPIDEVKEHQHWS